MSKTQDKRHKTELQYLSALLREQGFAAQFVEKSEKMPVNMLFVGLKKDRKDRERFFNCTYLADSEHFRKLTLLQIHAVFQFPVVNETDTQKLLSEINQYTHLGAFGLNANKQVYLRYLCALPRLQVINDEFLLQVIQMYALNIELFYNTIEDVAVGEQKVEIAMKTVGEQFKVDA